MRRRERTARERLSIARVLGVTGPERQERESYLRLDYVRGLTDEALVSLMDVLTNAPDRDTGDDATLDMLARVYGRRHAPLCRVCAEGVEGACDERCDWIGGAADTAAPVRP